MPAHEWVYASVQFADIIAALIFVGLGWTSGVYGVLLEDRVRKCVPTRLVRWTIVAWAALAVVFLAAGFWLHSSYPPTTWRLLLVAGSVYALLAAFLIWCLPLYRWLVKQTMLDPQRGAAYTFALHFLLNLLLILALYVVLSQDPQMFPGQVHLGMPWLIGIAAAMPLFVYVLYRRWRDPMECKR